MTPHTGENGEMIDPYTVALEALHDLWVDEETPDAVVEFIFTALGEAGDTTIPRDDAARARGVEMCGAVFGDLGPEAIAYEPVVSHILRAASRPASSPVTEAADD